LLAGIHSPDLKRIVNIIHVCCILHNICIDHNDVSGDDFELEVNEGNIDDEILPEDIYIDINDDELRKIQGRKKRDELAAMLMLQPIE